MEKSLFNMRCWENWISSVQFSHSVVSDSVTPKTVVCQASLSINSQSLLKLMFTESRCHPTISSSVIPFSYCLQSFPASGFFPMSRFFSSGGPKSCSFSFSISPYNEYSGLICSRTDWLDLPAVQGTLKSLFQCHRSKASILWC